MNETFSATVKARYVESGLSYGEFAALIDVSVPQLYLILRGVSNPPFLTIVEIARCLVIDPWILLGVSAVPDGHRKAHNAAARRPTATLSEGERGA